MSKKDFITACREQTNYTVATSRAALDMFCEILGYPKSQVNYFIGDDPHGVVDIMEGYRYFNMTDIHVVISEYEHWLELYGSNEEIRKQVDAWYFYRQEWSENTLSTEWRLGKEVPDVKERFTNGTPASSGRKYVRLLKNGKEEYAISFFDFTHMLWSCEIVTNGNKVEVTHWTELQSLNTHSLPNLRSWLAGCPVEGLREASTEYQEQQRKSLEEAHRRTEEAKEALLKAIEDEYHTKMSY